MISQIIIMISVIQWDWGPGGGDSTCTEAMGCLAPLEKAEPSTKNNIILFHFHISRHIFIFQSVSSLTYTFYTVELCIDPTAGSMKCK